MLAELARHPDGISLPRLCKRLGLRMSVLLRTLAWLGEDSIGGVPGPGWVRIETQGQRSIAALTPAGHAHMSAPADRVSPQERDGGEEDERS